MGHLFGMLDRIRDETLCLIESSLITALQSPGRFSLFNILVVSLNNPFNFFGFFFILVDTGRGGSGLRTGSRRDGRFGWLSGLLDLNTAGTKGAIEGTLLRDGMVILQRNVNSGNNTFW
jgi:hypothetical protein